MLPVPEFARPIIKKMIGIPGRLIPYAAQKPVLSIALNEAFREPLRHGELRFLEGARVRIKVTDLCIDWLLRVGADRFVPVDRAQQADGVDEQRQIGEQEVAEEPRAPDGASTRCPKGLPQSRDAGPKARSPGSARNSEPCGPVVRLESRCG